MHRVRLDLQPLGSSSSGRKGLRWTCFAAARMVRTDSYPSGGAPREDGVGGTVAGEDCCSFVDRRGRPWG